MDFSVILAFQFIAAYQYIGTICYSHEKYNIKYKNALQNTNYRMSICTINKYTHIYVTLYLQGNNLTELLCNFIENQFSCKILYSNIV